MARCTGGSRPSGAVPTMRASIALFRTSQAVAAIQGRAFVLPDDVKRMVQPVLALGNFDGVHRGHRKILERVRRVASERGAMAVVMTFDPHPPRVVRPDKAPPLLMTMAQKLEAIAEGAGRSMLELAMSWLAGQPAVSSVIAGATKVEQVHANAAAANWVLTLAEVAEVDAVIANAKG